MSRKKLLNKVRENNTLFVPLPKIIHHSGGLPLTIFKLQIPLIAVYLESCYVYAWCQYNIAIFSLWTSEYLQIKMYVILL